MSCAKEARVPSAARVCAQDLERVFNAAFAATHDTVLCGGADEPLYEPSAPGVPACIHFRHDYPSSALHEVAHWCIAGAQRRRQIDYGYWYAPDGRDARQQARFLAVEARPQALEWHFSRASGVPFRLSLDNLDAPTAETERLDFARAVVKEARAFQQHGLPPRARRFVDALARAYPGAAQHPHGLFSASELL